MAWNSLLDPVLGWVLTMPLWLGIAILSFILTLIINVVYKFATDQKEMKRLKEQIKKFQAQMKKHRENPKKVMEIQSRAWDVNKNYMIKSLRPTIYTLLPLLLIFSWMNANLALAPLDVGEQVDLLVELESPARVTLEVPAEVSVQGGATKDTIESQVSWSLSASDPGTYGISFTTEDGSSASRDLLVGSVPDNKRVAHDDPFKASELSYEKSKPFPGFSIFGYEPGWLLTYIFFSVLFSIVTRKIMGLY